MSNLIATVLPVSSPLDLLAHVQSLLLYQIIRILYGDSISAAQAAEDTITPHLEEAATALMESYIQFEDPPLPSSNDCQQLELEDSQLQFPLVRPTLDAARQCWETWVFQESARRTYLMVFFFVQIYRLLKGSTVPGGCDGRLGRRNHVFTVGEKVWAAKDPVEFARAWEGGRRWVVVNAE